PHRRALAGARHPRHARRHGAVPADVGVAPSARPEVLGEALQATLPAAGRADRAAHVLPALAVAVEAPVLELDPRALGPLGDEPHLDLARPGQVGLELPLRRDVPADHHAPAGLEAQHARPLALAAVDADVVDATARAELEDHLGQLTLED